MGETYRIYCSPLEMSDSMPCELSWSDRIGPQNLGVFRSKSSDEFRRLLSVLSITETCTGTGPIKGKIKYFLERVNACIGSSYLLQFWAPVTIGSKRYLTTSDQPFALAELVVGLCSYRKQCLDYLIPVDDMSTEEAHLGPRGRVFQNVLPKVSFDVLHYSTREFPQRDLAVSSGVHIYLALPLFEPPGYNCIGVLELVDVPLPACESLFYKYVVEHFMEILKEVDLRSSDIYHDFAVHTSRGPQKAFNEIRRALEVVWSTHQLPLAQTWVPISDSSHISKVRTTDKGSYFHIATDMILQKLVVFVAYRRGKWLLGEHFHHRGHVFAKT